MREHSAYYRVEIIPTVVPKTPDDVGNARKRYAFAPSLHIDIADGVFAPNTTWMIRPSEKLPEAGALRCEIHLMTENPLQPGLMFARAGATRVIGHVEAFDNVDRAREAFDMWRKAGAQETGIAVKLDTPLEDLMLYVELADFVHMMTIATIGKQGAPFDERAITRVQELHARYPKLVISVDGGENEKNMMLLAQAGATRFCVGSALAKAKDPSKTYAQLLNIVQTV